MGDTKQGGIGANAGAKNQCTINRSFYETDLFIRDKGSFVETKLRQKKVGGHQCRPLFFGKLSGTNRELFLCSEQPFMCDFFKESIQKKGLNF
jgi:hypothetical protein